MFKNILAINTTTRKCSVALLSEDQSYTASEYSERGHDGIVLALIDEVLQQAGLPKTAVDLLAFGRGPGAFTGIRVATAVTQGLAVGLNLKVVPVSDLLNIAYQHHKTSGQENIASCFDARMGEVYAAVVQFADNSFSYLYDERLIKPDAWSLPKEPFTSSLVGVGNGFSEFPELSTQLDITEEKSNFALLPTALATAELAQLMLELGFKAVDAIDALPVYLRNDVAHKKTNHKL